jgi:DNA-binding NarL/FixJ family response regulator
MKFLVVDDHPMFRDGVSAMLRQFPGVQSVLQAGDGQSGLKLVDEHDDLAAVLVDLRMEAMGGLVVIEQIKRRRPQLPAIVLSSSEDPADVRRAFAAGARGYCAKSSSPATLAVALNVVLAGELYVPPFLALTSFAEPATADTAGLTPRQREVLQAMARGLSNKQIGSELSMEEKTVKGHVSAIFKALKVVHRMQAVDAARNGGLLG